MNRRKFLTLAGIAGLGVAAESSNLIWQSTLQGSSQLTEQELIERQISGLITHFASGTNRFAWTIDDAADANVLAKYLDRAEKYDLKFTFFVNSSKHSWLSQADKLRALIQNGQVQLGNHSHNHLDLTLLSDAEVRSQIATCHSFLLDNFGVDARPFLRPPFRKIDKRVAAIAADLGYVKPTMWSNNLLNASPSTSPARTLSRFKTEAVDGAILLDHMHGLESDTQFGAAVASLKAKGLATVTLKDAFGE